MLIRPNIFLRAAPYLIFSVAVTALYVIYNCLTPGGDKEIVLGILSNGVFFFVVFIFFDLVRSINYKKESKYLNEYIKNKVGNDVFVALYFQKKILHGYNLETNTLDNIMGVIDYSQTEISRMIRNQRYLGFQIFKNIDEVKSLFEEVLNSNLILKYSSHTETINLLKITNNLSVLETIFKDESNFKKSHSKSLEFEAVDGKIMNADNPEGYILLRRTPKKDIYVVYDSGVFEKRHTDKLIQEYVLKSDLCENVASLIYETLHLMKEWLPEVTRLRRREDRFRIIKEYFSPSTQLEFGDAQLYVADIVKKKE
jgi:hypothetical protein